MNEHESKITRMVRESINSATEKGDELTKKSI